MFDKELAKKIDDLIMVRFPIIYEYEFDGIVLLYGGAIRNLIIDAPVKDLDFLILSQNDCTIKEFIKKYKLNYQKNAFDSYKILWQNNEVDMLTTDDLLTVGLYDTDLMFYDIYKHKFIICGVNNAVENATITQINKYQKPILSYNTRLNKIKNFVRIVSGKNKVKVKHNKILWCVRMFKELINIFFKEVIYGNFRKNFKFYNKNKLSLLFILSLLFVLMDIFLLILFFYNMLNKYYNLSIIFLMLITLLYGLKNLIFNKLKLSVSKDSSFNIYKDLSYSVLNISINDCTNDNLKFNVNKVVSLFIKNYIFLCDTLIFIILIMIMFLINLKFCLILLLLIFINLFLNLQLFRMTREKRDNFSDKYFLVFNKYILKIINKKLLICLNGIYVLLFVLFGMMFINNNIIFSSLVIFICLYSISYVYKLYYNIHYVNDFYNSSNLFFNLLDGTLYDREIYGNKYNKKCNGVIEFSNVKFRYKYDDDYVLDDYSLKIDKNQVVGLINETKEEKRAILNLISRLYNTDDGLVKIDNIDITEYSENYIRENIATISQNPYLFDMSIKDNLRLVKEDITDKEIVNVCKLVCLDEFIKSLPDKYDTIIGYGGVKLSGELKQRLGIARAILKNTKIIMLDDCNYEDRQSYEIIKDIIKKLKKKYTVIIVSEDNVLSSVCDKIY